MQPLDFIQKWKSVMIWGDSFNRAARAIGSEWLFSLIALVQVQPDGDKLLSLQSTPYSPIRSA